MTKIFRKNNVGRMSWVLHQRRWYWQLISLLLVVFSIFLGYLNVLVVEITSGRLDFSVIILGIFCISFSMFVLLTAWSLIKFLKELRSLNRLSDYLLEKKACVAIEHALLSAGLVRRTVSESVVDVPRCSVAISEPSTVVTIERLPSVSDIDKVAKAVESSLRFGKLSDYAITESIETPDGLFYEFELSDVNRDLTFVPEEISDLVPSDPYVFRLMEGLDWSYVNQSHCIISGLTGSRKTTTMFLLLAQAMAVGAEVYLIDYKQEFTPFKKILGDDHVVSDPDEVLKVLDVVVDKMIKRHKKIALESESSNRLGVTGADFNARPVFIIAEELGALSEAYNAKEKKVFHGYLKQIAMLGRSCLFNLIVLLQIATVESAPAGIKSNTNLKILLGKSTSEMVGQVFSSGYIEQVSLNPGIGKGWFFLNGETTQPKLFFVPDLHKNELNSLDVFAELYEIGKTKVYNDAL